MRKGKSAQPPPNGGSVDLREAPPEEALRKILLLLRNKTHVDLSQYKLTTIRRRIQRQMMLSKMADMQAYAAYLRTHPEAIKALHDDIFIHVTEFFRDPESFQALREHVFPALSRAKGASEPIRVWVPGCSTGEEAFSIAMALLEYLEERSLQRRIQIFATDISEGAIKSARRAVYPEAVAKALGTKRIQRFFEPFKEGYKIKKELRDLCVISRHDVTVNPPFAKIDLISCRNVLIYFGSSLQKRILPVFHYALNPGGFLWLGQSESPGSFSKLFSLVDKRNKIYSKSASSSPAHLRLPTNHFVASRIDIRRPENQMVSERESLNTADQLLLFKYGPPAVIISSDLEIRQFKGKTTPFLAPPPGHPSHGLLKMAHPDLVADLRMLVQAAKKKNLAVRKENISVEAEGVMRTLNAEISPINPNAPEKERQYLVVFEEVPRRAGAGKRSHRGTGGKRSRARSLDSAGSSDSKDLRLSQLQHELDSLRDYQQGLVEQFESTQEELTSANEELQATNEELQSTNEELETAKEELQSANEELTTMNDELQSRNTELSAAYEKLARGEDRFRMMVEGVRDYAIFMLDPEGRIATWNEGARRLKGYETSEIVGRHFSAFYPREDIERKKPQCELERARIEGRVEDEGWRIRKDGTRFWASVIITRINDRSGNLVGFSKVTRDLTERREAEEKLKLANQGLEARVRERTQELEHALAARDEFLSIASHELKTPLTSLKLQLQMTRRKTNPEKALAPPPGEMAQALDLGIRQSESLAKLVEDLLDMSRIRTGKFSLELAEMSLLELVQDTLDRLAPQLMAAGVSTELMLDGTIRGRWDRRRLEQVLVNLLSNVIRYAPNRPVHIESATQGDRVFLSVRDFGPGIEKTQQPRIFQRFERGCSDRHIGGLGLGLFIAYRIIEAHHGTIHVESEAGHGATFRIELPLDPGRESPAGGTS